MAPMSIAVPVSTQVSVPPEAAFDAICPVELPAVFERWGPVPGVREVRDQTGPWTVAGSSRTVVLEDGSELDEKLLAVDRPGSFSYRVGPFPKPFGFLVSHADGEWRFSPEGRGTRVDWTYRFAAKPGRAPLVRVLLAPVWRRYAAAALERCRRVVEATHAGAAAI